MADGVSLSRGVLDAYVCSANTAVTMKLVAQEEDLHDDIDFFPEFTHQFFGDGESIFGYRNLKIMLYYSASRLNTYLSMSYTDKITEERSGGVKPDNVIKIIGERYLGGFESNIDTFVSSLKKEATFRPFGEKLHSVDITLKEEGNIKRTFEIYKCDMACPNFKKYHERIQTFILWFIDAASFIDIDDDRWDYFVMYEKYQEDGRTNYAFVGYTTVYRYYAYPSKQRPRISQMLILPPFQKRGLGAELLQTIYKWYIKDNNTIDITVEDPSENFMNLRDFVDAKNCSKLPSYHPSKLTKGFSLDMRQEALLKLKINKKQARRIYEILRLQATDTTNKLAYKMYRLDVKNRLNAPYQRQKNDIAKLEHTLSPDELKAALQNSSREQRIEQLDKQYRDLEDEYRHTLERLASSPRS